MKWLFVTSQFPWPITHGQWLRVYHLVRALIQQGDDVDLLTCGRDAMAPEGVAAYESLGARIVDGPANKHLNQGRARTFMGPYAFDPRMADAVSKQSQSMDTIVLSHSRMLQYSREASPYGRVIADIGDDPVLEYGRRRQTGTETQSWLRRMKARIGRMRYERYGISHVTAATFVSDADATSFGMRHPSSQTCCVPNGVDIDYFQRPPDYKTRNQPPTIVFTGHMGNPNNLWAAEYLVRSVAPLVWSKMPEVRIEIVGADPTDDVLALADERVIVTGTVPDIREHIWNADLVTLTMQSGTGIKNKLLEAWAAGTAVVATPLACQGVDAKDGRNLAVACTAEQFANTVIELLSDRCKRDQLAVEGRRTVVEQFTWPAAAARLRSVAQGVIPSSVIAG